MKSNGKKKTSLSDRIFVICNTIFMIAFVIITPLTVPEMAMREKYLHFESICTGIRLSTNVISE